MIEIGSTVETPTKRPAVVRQLSDAIALCYFPNEQRLWWMPIRILKLVSVTDSELAPKSRKTKAKSLA